MNRKKLHSFTYNSPMSDYLKSDSLFSRLFHAK